MRKIRFRGKDTMAGEWVYGSLLKFDGNYHIVSETDMCEDGHIRQESDIPTWVEPDTVGQYTGMEDDSGNEIYEDDILKVKDIFDEEFECVVCFDNDYHHAFGLRDICRKWYHFREIESMTIIGNIHDNKELKKIEQLKKNVK